MRTNWLRVGGLPLAVVLGAAGTFAQPIDRLGALGDSLSDEYFEETYDYARNWSVLLVEERGVDMGPTAEEAGQPGGTWGEPRRTGYEDDWARSGATTGSAIASGQHTGLADGAVHRDVTHGVVWIGTNDFGDVYDEIYFGIFGQAEIDAFIAARLADYETILDTLAPTGLLVVLAVPPDIGATPLVEAIFPNPLLRDLVTAAFAQFRDTARLLAAERELVFVDAFALGQAIFGTNTAPEEVLLVGNVPIDLDGVDTPAGGDPDAAFVDDGFHPNTVLQGVIANVLTRALRYHGATEALFSEEEILGHAGLAYGGADTLLAEIGPYEGFIENFAVLFGDGFESGDTSAWSAVVAD